MSKNCEILCSYSLVKVLCSWFNIIFHMPCNVFENTTQGTRGINCFVAICEVIVLRSRVASTTNLIMCSIGTVRSNVLYVTVNYYTLLLYSFIIYIQRYSLQGNCNSVYSNTVYCIVR